MPILAMQTRPAQAGPPPIPPVPPTAGAATGGQAVGVSPPSGTAVSPTSTREIIENAVNEAQQAAGGQAVTVVPPPRIVQVSPDIPPEVIPIIAIVFGSVAFMVVFGPITRGIMRMIERRQERNMVQGPPIAQQLQQLQQSVDTMAIELERISESQRFQSKLMAEREKSALPPKANS